MAVGEFQRWPYTSKAWRELRFNVFALRDKMFDMLKTRYGDWYDCYIVGGYPNKQERERLAWELGAELVYVE